MEKQLLLIGKGQKELVQKNFPGKEYRQSTCFRFGKDADSIKTPFTEEAIVRLHRDRFDDVHIFGTPDALWDALCDHCCRCHIIPVCKKSMESWDIFRMITKPELDMEGSIVSIDIAQSLRYYSAVNSRTWIVSIFIGAFELQDKFEKKALIFDLRLFTEIIQWIDATNSFSQYGDLIPISESLRSDNADDALMKKLWQFSDVIQLNISRAIRQNCRQLIGLLSDYDFRDQTALEVIAPALNAFQGISEIFFNTQKNLGNKALDGIVKIFPIQKRSSNKTGNR